MTNRLYELTREKFLRPRTFLPIENAITAGGLIQINVGTGTVGSPVPMRHGLITGDVIFIADVAGVTAANGSWTVTRVGSDASSAQITLQGSTFSGTYTAQTGNIFLVGTGTGVNAPLAMWKRSPHVVRWDTDDIKVALVNLTSTGGSDPATTYPASGTIADALATHSWLSDIPSAARLAVSHYTVTPPGPEALSSKTTGTGSGTTFIGGIAGAANITFPTVTPSGMTVEAFVIYKDTGDALSSALIAFEDVATGLTVTTNGGDITIQWDTGANRIFKL